MKDQKKIWEVALRRIFKRASTDPIYRKLCLVDPQSALKLISGIKMPSGLDFRFTDNKKEEVFSEKKITLLLPPLVKINFTDNDLIVTKENESIHVAAYENWGSEKIEELSSKLSYENWGSEKSIKKYENWGSELVKYENWGSESHTKYENWGSESANFENWGSESVNYENWGSEKK